jgi:hypothetical protein
MVIATRARGASVFRQSVLKCESSDREERIRITSVAVSGVAGSTIVRCPAIRRVDRCAVAVSVVRRSVVAKSGTVWNASGQTRYQSNDYRQVFEHRRLRSAKVTRRIEFGRFANLNPGLRCREVYACWA